MFGVDMKKLEEKVKDSLGDREMTSFDREFRHLFPFEGESPYSVFGGEIIFGVNAFSEDMFSGWNLEKLEIFFGISFQSSEKAEMFVKHLAKTVMKRSGDNDLNSLIKEKILSKPVIQEYN